METAMTEHGGSPRAFDQNTYAFELGAIHGKLETLNAGQDEICRRLDVDVKSRLDKVNGSIATLYDRTDENKAALLTHVIECPQKEKIEKLAAKLDDKEAVLTEKLTIIEQRIAGLDRMIGERLASEKTSSTWREKLLYPLVRIAGTGLLLLALYHAQQILKRL
jgi:hypothetical protein